MEIEVKDGLNIISIGVNDLGSYFRFHDPVSLVWRVEECSARRYMCQMPINGIERQEFFDEFQSDLMGDFTGRIEDLYEILKPLFKLFPNGEYDLEFDSGIGKNIEVVDLDRDYYPEWELKYAKDVIDLERTRALIDDHKNVVAEDIYSLPHTLIRMTTTSFYKDRSFTYLATLPKASLDANKVLFFEEKIKNNERPFAILMRVNSQDDWIAREDFLLEGHHKLQAYKNLNIEPAFAVICRNFIEDDELEFDVDKLAELLYPWQIRHILDNWEEKHIYFPKLLERADSKLHGYVRNGAYNEYYYDGNPKKAGFYTDDLADGLVKTWSVNGKLTSECHFTGGIRTGLCKNYYRNGMIENMSSYDNEGRPHGEFISYLEDGKIRSMQSYTHGKHTDGREYTNSYRGILEFECWYEDGVMFASKTYDYRGDLTAIKRHAPSRAYIPMPPPTIKSHADADSPHLSSRPGFNNSVQLLRTVVIIIMLLLALLRFLI